MKRLIGCVIMAAVIFLFSIGAVWWCDKVTGDIKKDVAVIITATSDNDYDTAYKACLKAEGRWKDLSRKTVFVEDSDCDNEIIMSLSRIKQLCESRDEEIYTECTVLLELLDLFMQRQYPTLANVF